MRYVADNLKKRVSRTDAARIANLEPAHFSKLFRRIAGVGFTVWCAELRVDRAKPFLAIVDLPMNDVAAAVGFADATTLGRNFRKCTGMCPRDFRRRVLAASTDSTQIAEINTQNAETNTQNAATPTQEAR